MKALSTSQLNLFFEILSNDRNEDARRPSLWAISREKLSCWRSSPIQSTIETVWSLRKQLSPNWSLSKKKRLESCSLRWTRQISLISKLSLTKALPHCIDWHLFLRLMTCSVRNLSKLSSWHQVAAKFSSNGLSPTLMAPSLLTKSLKLYLISLNVYQ